VGAIFGGLFALVLLLMLSVKSGKKPPDATPEQLAEVERLGELGYSLAWLEDGTAMLYSAHLKTILVSKSGHASYASAKYRNKRVP
jgi:hypothetical protein